MFLGFLQCHSRTVVEAGVELTPSNVSEESVLLHIWTGWRSNQEEEETEDNEKEESEVEEKMEDSEEEEEDVWGGGGQGEPKEGGNEGKKEAGEEHK